MTKKGSSVYLEGWHYQLPARVTPTRVRPLSILGLWEHASDYECNVRLWRRLWILRRRRLLLRRRPTQGTHQIQRLPGAHTALSLSLYTVHHRHNQDFVWGALFHAKKTLWPFFTRRPQRPRLNTHPNLTRPAKTVLKLTLALAVGALRVLGGALTHFPCKLRLKIFFTALRLCSTHWRSKSLHHCSSTSLRRPWHWACQFTQPLSKFSSGWAQR